MDTPGRATSQTIADYLVSGVLTFALPHFRSRTRRICGRQNRSQEWLDAISNAKKYVSEQIVMGTDTSLENWTFRWSQISKFPFIPRTSEKFDGVSSKGDDDVYCTTERGQVQFDTADEVPLACPTRTRLLAGSFWRKGPRKQNSRSLRITAGCH